MHHRRQFVMRENPASDRRHGSRLEKDPKSNSNYLAERSAEGVATTALAKPAFADADASVHAASNGAAATGRKSAGNDRLLTVQEVAELLCVPASWVYGRTRKRSLQRLPAYRLGKYWRFREDEIHAWVNSQRREGRNA